MYSLRKRHSCLHNTIEFVITFVACFTILLCYTIVLNTHETNIIITKKNKVLIHQIMIDFAVYSVPTKENSATLPYHVPTSKIVTLSSPPCYYNNNTQQQCNVYPTFYLDMKCSLLNNNKQNTQNQFIIIAKNNNKKFKIDNHIELNSIVVPSTIHCNKNKTKCTMNMFFTFTATKKYMYQYWKEFDDNVLMCSQFDIYYFK